MPETIAPAAGFSPSPTVAPDAPAKRVESVDALRGLVMVLMALDHVRDYFSNFSGDPLAPSTTTSELFFTRWITHFCAPVFVFLAGMAVWFQGSRGRSVGAISRQLWKRGLWLLVLEFTVVKWGWTFRVEGTQWEGQVIWALGVSMIFLAGFVYLPVRWNLGIGLALIAGHNAWDGVQFAETHWFAVPWAMLHGGGQVRLGGNVQLYVLYPLVPWIGVMQVGYGMGGMFALPARERMRRLILLGLGLILLFLLLRATNLYGDREPWETRGTWMRTLFSFLNCSKYPPSLLFLLMTLGPGLLLLGAFEHGVRWVPRWLGVFGRVPLFYYLVHLYLIHGAAGLTAWALGRKADAAWVLNNAFFSDGRPEGYGYSLGAVYLAWLAIVAVMYPLCAWYDRLKRRSRHPLLSYL